MARVINYHPNDHATATALAAPRDDWLIKEEAIGGDFACALGPFSVWSRSIAARDDHLVETIEYRIAAPLWGRAFELILRRYLHKPPRSSPPWWAPPDRFDAAGARALSLLSFATLAAAYLGTLLSQTITFVADEFDASRTVQGLVTSMTRGGALIALVIVWAADRYGRRRLLLAAGIGASVMAALAAVSPSIWFYGGTQLVSRGLATGFGILIGVVAAEESPAGARAWVTSVLALCAGLGSGIVLWFVPLADSGLSTWRWMFVVALGALPVLWYLRNNLTETRRFNRMVETNQPPAPITPLMRKRFAMLAVVGFATSMFAAPASNFQLEYLRDERGFSGSRISLYTSVVSTPIGIGVAIAGPIADRRGRRLVGAIGVLAGVVFAVMRYNVAGPLMWIAGVASIVIGAAAIPALGVYGPELFPTSRRGLANGLLTIVAVIGSVMGLTFVGIASEQWSFGRAFAWLSIVPLLAILVIARYPKTARRALEELNPEDQVARSDIK